MTTPRGCLPGLRPDGSRSDPPRGLRCGGSDDDGFEEFEESFPARRDSHSTRSTSASARARAQRLHQPRQPQHHLPQLLHQQEPQVLSKQASSPEGRPNGINRHHATTLPPPQHARPRTPSHPR
jgi:hypothetical protein